MGTGADLFPHLGLGRSGISTGEKPPTGFWSDRPSMSKNAVVATTLKVSAVYTKNAVAAVVLEVGHVYSENPCCCSWSDAVSHEYSENSTSTGTTAAACAADTCLSVKLFQLLLQSISQ